MSSIANPFIKTITVPALDSATFALDLQEIFQNIDDNFKKIVSAPYLEGQEGRSVDTVDMLIVENGELTEFGRGVASTIVGQEVESISGMDSVCPPIGGGTHKISDYLFEHPTMKVFCKDSQDTYETDDYICSAEYYCFLDMRVEDLGYAAYPSSVTTFSDKTCQIFAKYIQGLDNSRWEFTKGVMLPTVYYDSGNGCFCWKVNSVKTGIRAQGIKGDDGRPPLAAVVKGDGIEFTPVGGQVVVNIDINWYLKTYGTEDINENYGEWEAIENSGIMDGDLVCCLFDITDATAGTTYTDMVIGNIKVEDNLYYMTVLDSCRFSSLWREYVLFYAFQGIDYKSTTMRNTKAIFIPSRIDNVVHAIFQDDSKVVYSGDPVVSQDTETEANTLVFKKVNIDRLLGTKTVSNEYLMSKTDTDTGHVEDTTKIKFAGYSTSATVNSMPDVLLGVPVGSVVSWMNTGNIPQGWFVVGTVTDEILHKPVFAIKQEGYNSEDFDIVGIREGRMVYKANLYSIDQDGTTLSRNSAFGKILCQLTGRTFSEPIVVQTDARNWSEFVGDLTSNWPFSKNAMTGNQMNMYLTKMN